MVFRWLIAALGSFKAVEPILPIENDAVLFGLAGSRLKMQKPFDEQTG